MSNHNKKRGKRNNNVKKTECSTCHAMFLTRKERRIHQRLVHFKSRPLLKVRPVAELYAEEIRNGEQNAA